MADIIPVGFAQVTIPFKHALLTRAAAVTFGIDVGTNTEDTFLANEILERFADAFDAAIDNSVVMGPAVAAFGRADGTTNPVSGSTTRPGVDAQESEAPNNALLLRKLTSRGGRRGRGRMFVPWALAEGAVDEAGRLNAATIADGSLRGTNWLTAMDDTTPEATNMPVVLLHSASDPEVQNPTDPGSPDLVTGIVADPIVGSQRRRLGR